MAKAAKRGRPAKKKNTWGGARVQIPLTEDEMTDTFEIEVSPPLPPDKSAAVSEMMLQKLATTVEKIKPGQAFIMPKRIPDKIRGWLSENYPDEKFILTRIAGNETHLRVYWLKRNKK